jgi:two-component system, sensor histidine kinase and response regulator
MARILIVDDDPIVLDLVRDLLLMQGHAVDSAPDGAQALARLAAQPCDLLVIDRSMPVMDGIAAVTALRRDPRFAALKVLMFTSAADPETREAALRAGVDGFLRKPIQMAEFSAAIQAVLAG